MQRIAKVLLKALSLSALILSATAFAEEPVQLMEEVTVVGAVRSSAVQVADVDLPADAALQELPVIVE